MTISSDRKNNSWKLYYVKDVSWSHSVYKDGGYKATCEITRVTSIRSTRTVLNSRARVNKRVYNVGNPDLPLRASVEIARRYPACECDATVHIAWLTNVAQEPTCWIQGARASNAEDLSLHPGQKWRLTITIEELERFPSILMFTPDSRWHFSDRSQIVKTSGNLLLIVQ